MSAYRTAEPDTCSNCGADATCTREDGERYCERCLPPVRLVPVHEHAAMVERAAAVEAALSALVKATDDATLVEIQRGHAKVWAAAMKRLKRARAEASKLLREEG